MVHASLSRLLFTSAFRPIWQKKQRPQSRKAPQAVQPRNLYNCPRSAGISMSAPAADIAPSLSTRALSPLSKVSDGRTRPLAGKASQGTSPDALRACSLYATSSVGFVGFAEQEGRLRPSVPHQRGNTSGNCSRSQTSGRSDRLLQRATHLESETRTSPACALCDSRWGVVSRSHTLDPHTLHLLSSCQSPRSRLSR